MYLIKAKGKSVVNLRHGFLMALPSTGACSVSDIKYTLDLS